MADKTPRTTPTPGADDKTELQKRARRRLVGAIALALLAIIVLPMVMDQEPRPGNQDIQIRIPSLDAAVSSRITPLDAAPVTTLPSSNNTTRPATPQPAEKSAAEKAATAQAEPAATDKQQSEARARAQSAEHKQADHKQAEKKLAEQQAAEKLAAEKAASERKAQETARAAAILNDEQWVIQLGAYQSQANVNSLQAKIKELGYPVYTEKVDTPQGTRIRVRCGPFATQEAAEQAHQRLKKIAAGGPSGGTLTKLH